MAFSPPLTFPNSACCRLIIVSLLWVSTGSIAFAEPGNLVNSQVLDSVEVDFGPRSIIYNRVETPALKPQPTPIPQAPPAVEGEPTAEELAELAAWNAKADFMLFLSCTVYDRAVTEIHWQHEGGEYVIWSGVDFNHLRGASGFETERARFTLFLGIGDESSESANMTIPEVPAGEYRIVSFPQSGIAPDVLLAMDELHAFYRQNREQLRQAYELSEAKRLEQEAWDRANPPVPKDTVIHYFPIRSAYNEGEPR